MALQLWATNSLGGFWSNNEFSKQFRAVAQPTMRLRAAVQIKGAKGARAGDKLYFDKRANVTTAGGTLTETATIPETQFVTKQGTLTITEYGDYLVNIAVLKLWPLLEHPKACGTICYA